MAIDFIKANPISRKNSPRGIVAKLAYNSCSQLFDERQNKLWDYTNKESLIEEYLVNARNNTLEQLSNKLEADGKRSDSRTAREFIIALPFELDKKDWRKITDQFADKFVKDFGLAVHVAIHKPDPPKDEEKYRSTDSYKNYHAHIVLSEKAMGEDGNFFGNKDRRINSKAYLAEVKKFTRDIMNDALASKGFEKIQERDPEKITTEHLGPALSKKERRGEKTLKGERNEAIKEFNELIDRKNQLEKEAGLLEKGQVSRNGATAVINIRNLRDDATINALSRRDIDKLYEDIERGKLRPKKWLAPGVLESISFYGKEVSVHELLLADQGFSFERLKKLEKSMDNQGGVDWSHFGIFLKRDIEK